MRPRCRTIERAAAGLAHHREGLREQVVQRFAIGEALAEIGGLQAQRFVAERLGLVFFGVDLGDERPNAFQLTLILGADDLREEGIDDHSLNRTGIQRF